jgi:hypothetical protein
MSDNAIVLADEKNKLMTPLAGFAAMLSNLTPEQVPGALDIAIALRKLGEEVADRLRDRLAQTVAKDGETYTDKGSKRASIGGFKVTVIPTKTGTDPKKLEAKLRALGKDPANYMDATITYKVNPGKLALLVMTKYLALEDVAYSPDFRVGIERE